MDTDPETAQLSETAACHGRPILTRRRSDNRGRGLATGVAGSWAGQPSGVGSLGKAMPLLWWHTVIRLLVSSPGTLVVQPPVSFAEDGELEPTWQLLLHAGLVCRAPVTFVSGGGSGRSRSGS
jgi:hypothetical protein